MQLLTCSADGTAKLIQISQEVSEKEELFQVTKTWNIAEFQSCGTRRSAGKKVRGANTTN